MTEPTRRKLIHASEVANYVVCPESWRLKQETGSEEPEIHLQQKGSEEGSTLRANWLAKQNLIAQLAEYAKIVYLLIVLLVVVVFLWEHARLNRDQGNGKLFGQPHRAELIKETNQ